LDDADGRVQHDDQGDDHELGHVAQHRGDAHRREQHQYEGIA
jgi:hypothetical protein